MNNRITNCVEHNDGIISTGANTHNIVIKASRPCNDINWDMLSKEIQNLQTNPDASIRKFADESMSVINNKNKGGLKNILLKWIPCIGSLIESSYYIIEIAKKFNIGM